MRLLYLVVYDFVKSIGYNNLQIIYSFNLYTFFDRRMRMIYAIHILFNLTFI